MKQHKGCPAIYSGCGEVGTIMNKCKEEKV